MACDSKTCSLCSTQTTGSPTYSYYSPTSPRSPETPVPSVQPGLPFPTPDESTPFVPSTSSEPENNTTSEAQVDWEKYGWGQKTPLSFLRDLPLEALQGAAEVMAHGAQKYGRDNWMQCYDETAYLDAALRHLLSSEPVDADSGLKAIDHAIASLLIYRALGGE